MTRRVAENLYTMHDTINGLTREAFAERLDRAQAAADGPTSLLPWWLVPFAQADHSLALPLFRSVGENAEAIVEHIMTELELARAAHQDGRADDEIAHLGAALHTIEDGYGGHVWRDQRADHGNPLAEVEAINTYDPTLLVNLPRSLDDWVLTANTHDISADHHERDDDGNVTLKNVDLAAIEAGTAVLNAYLGQRESPHMTEQLAGMVRPLYELSQDARVNWFPTPQWLTEDGQRAAGLGQQPAPTTEACEAPPEQPVTVDSACWGPLACVPEPVNDASAVLDSACWGPLACVPEPVNDVSAVLDSACWGPAACMPEPAVVEPPAPAPICPIDAPPAPF
ncbi:hypothetical protein [Dactylosporangium darangshiense]